MSADSPEAPSTRVENISCAMVMSIVPSSFTAITRTVSTWSLFCSSCSAAAKPANGDNSANVSKQAKVRLNAIFPNATIPFNRSEKYINDRWGSAGIPIKSIPFILENHRWLRDGLYTFMRVKSNRHRPLRCRSRRHPSGPIAVCRTVRR
uniref:Uncharacterized protein n=1 Tax=uncultured marine group II/III euryarchaeote KM3_05_H10 TaxID=1457839 RepID=A0A075G4Z8_9EURY|nr:hypothetical protein [uncultured marine group II/III euryarchaeote KM3_05_H10]